MFGADRTKYRNTKMNERERRIDVPQIYFNDVDRLKGTEATKAYAA
jgi:hypothetical protein